MTEWWYQDGGVKNGPVTQGALSEMLAQGRLGRDTAVWTPSMAGWGPIGAQAEFCGAGAGGGHAAVVSGAGASAYPLAKSWRRWLARLFDLWWESVLVFLALGAVLRLSWPAFAQWIETPFAGKLFGLLCIPVALVFDAVLHAVAGNTPGKAMLGVRVGQADGRPLAFAQLVRRNLAMWISGLGLGVPLIALFTMGRQYGRLRQGQPASYDGGSFLVRGKPIGWARRTGFGLLFLFVFLMSFPRNDQAGSGKAGASPAAASFTWTNPATGRSASVPSQWKYAEQASASGAMTYQFIREREATVVAIVSAKTSGVDVALHSRALHKALSNEWRMREDVLEDFRGRPSWTATGEKEGVKLRLQLRMVQVGETLWWVSVTQPIPVEVSADAIDEMTGKLWDTVVTGQEPGTAAR